jgi:ferric-dicitrate binding protein FerR (iron transport regulator)
MTQLTDINNDLIIKYLRESLSEAEKLQVIAWLESNEQNREFLFGLKEAYLISRWESVKGTADVDNEWKKIHTNIIEAQKINKKSTLRIFKQITKYAAIIIVAFGIGTIFNHFLESSQPRPTTFSTGLGRSSELILNDGSKVTLNAKSTLIYNNQSIDNREVTLIGEAVFDIKKNHDKPFYVNTSYYRIKVLGTLFNVSTYDNDDYVSTTLKRGIIQIVDTKSNKILTELKEGQRFYLDKKTGNYSINKQKDLNDDFGWYEGKLCFNDIPLKDLTNKLEREFGYSIEIKNHDIQTYRYKANIEKESIENIMRYISFVTPDVQYKINEETKKILIY